MERGWGTAVCDVRMSSGRHYAEFTLLNPGARVGVVGPDFDPNDSRPGGPWPANITYQAWLLDSRDGRLRNAAVGKAEWPGQPSGLKQGDVVVRI